MDLTIFNNKKVNCDKNVKTCNNLLKFANMVNVHIQTLLLKFMFICTLNLVIIVK
jgi:hypothetical protein